jgi:multiple sugar transport system permease protein/raffinose/stachyose/melibiose transport system permease protein
MRERASSKIVSYICAVTIAVISVIPFVWVLLSSVKTTAQIRNPAELIPSHITFINFREVLFGSMFITYFNNSTFVAIVTTFVCIVLAVMASYGFTRYRIFASFKIRILVLFTRMFPGVLLSVPYYIIMQKLRLIDTHLCLIIIYCSFTLPFALWNISSFFRQIPWDLEEAAFIDGCNRFRAFFSVILPVAAPGIFATSLYCFLNSWDEYMYAMIFISTTAKKTIQVGISDFIGEYSTEWGSLMAAVVMSLVPTFVFFSIVQKNLVGGLSAGAVKG